ncbi:MAG: hypothetical protein B7X02_01750 [Rhodospirillales bacterium 12-54-5]|nr:MAG: hypothetical protein B7X02_01750 [Rhodospirillales bacterium 12-54-5]
MSATERLLAGLFAGANIGTVIINVDGGIITIEESGHILPDDGDADYVDTRFELLEARVDTAEGGISDAQTRIGDLEQQGAELEVGVAAALQGVVDVGETAKAIEACVNDLTVGASDTHDRLTALETAVTAPTAPAAGAGNAGSNEDDATLLAELQNARQGGGGPLADGDDSDETAGGAGSPEMPAPGFAEG